MTQSLNDPELSYKWLSPIVGALAPPTVFFGGNTFDGGALNALGAFCVWALGDLFIGYCVTLPVLFLAWRLGVRHWLGTWVLAAFIGAPMGYVLANPLEFAWSPTDEQFQHGPYWFHMFEYMALFGLTGLAYAVSANASDKERSKNAA